MVSGEPLDLDAPAHSGLRPSSGAAGPTPYYRDDFATIYHGDCREVLPSLGAFDLLLSDPPYPGYEKGWDVPDVGAVLAAADAPVKVSPPLASRLKPLTDRRRLRLVHRHAVSNSMQRIVSERWVWHDRATPRRRTERARDGNRRSYSVRHRPRTRREGWDMSAKKRRKSGLTTLELHQLEQACQPVWSAFGHTYLVGTAQTGGKYRDVDVRTILSDDDFDRLFGIWGGHGVSGEAFWALVCSSVGRVLAERTGLPIDYQIQRMTEANEKYQGERNPVGHGGRVYAGGGDATTFALTNDWEAGSFVASPTSPGDNE